MATIKKLTPDDENYAEVAAVCKKYNNKIDYRQLAKTILSSEAGTILDLQADNRFFTRHISAGLARRKLIVGKHYDIAFRTLEDNSTHIYITVKG